VAHKVLIAGTAYEATGGKTLVSGTVYDITGGKTMVGGTAYDIDIGTRLGDVLVGGSVFLNVNGRPVEFLVVHQGNPNSDIYDSSCDGTWLLMKDIYTTSQWYSSDDPVGYNYSELHNYLNGTFYKLLDADVRSLIVNATLPYVVMFSGGGSVCNKKHTSDGKTGMPARVFALSVIEVYPGANDMMWVYRNEGSCLSYFSDRVSSTDRSELIAYLNGTAAEWWLRSLYATTTENSVWTIYSNGSTVRSNVTSERGVRPALIMPADTKLNKNFCVVA
jgi:hypothetical protein